MSTHNICFCREIRKISAFFQMRKAPYLLLCFFVQNNMLIFSFLYPHTIVAGYYGSILDLHVSVHLSVFRFVMIT